jgi:hypothetical protein
MPFELSRSQNYHNQPGNSPGAAAEFAVRHLQAKVWDVTELPLAGNNFITARLFVSAHPWQRCCLTVF